MSVCIDWVKMAANTLKFLIPITEFLDTEVALAIKPTPENEDHNIVLA